jgi:hypothetical protein
MHPWRLFLLNAYPSSGRAGPDWHAVQSRNELTADKVFAGPATVVLIGWPAKGPVFDSLERITSRRWAACSAEASAKSAVHAPAHAP